MSELCEVCKSPATDRFLRLISKQWGEWDKYERPPAVLLGTWDALNIRKQKCALCAAVIAILKEASAEEWLHKIPTAYVAETYCELIQDLKVHRHTLKEDYLRIAVSLVICL